jgi:hypothetical protein
VRFIAKILKSKSKIADTISQKSQIAQEKIQRVFVKEFL